MEKSNILSQTLLLYFLINGAASQERVFIDVKTDIPTNDESWMFDCNGYGDQSTSIDCGEFGGRINIPPEDLNGERGFWASCGYCVISYNVKAEDISLKARLYQRSIQTEVSFDGVNWEFIQGEGWVVLDREFQQGETHVISFRFEHFTSDMFNLLEKIAINGDFEPPTDPEPTTTTTTESGTSVGSTATSDCPTTTVEPEPCNCCDRCSRQQSQEIHHHYHNHYYYHPASVPDAK